MNGATGSSSVCRNVVASPTANCVVVLLYDFAPNIFYVLWAFECKLLHYKKIFFIIIPILAGFMNSFIAWSINKLNSSATVSYTHLRAVREDTIAWASPESTKSY